MVRHEKDQLVAKQPGLDRPEAVCAALIPIRKNAAWWALPQDERRNIFEEQSKHVGIGLQYLPAIARRLHHCRDLGENEPFDFLTWFEFAPSHEADFDKLVAELRASKEWTYVDREVDIRCCANRPNTYEAPVVSFRFVMSTAPTTSDFSYKPKFGSRQYSQGFADWLMAKCGLIRRYSRKPGTSTVTANV